MRRFVKYASPPAALSITLAGYLWPALWPWLATAALGAAVAVGALSAHVPSSQVGVSAGVLRFKVVAIFLVLTAALVAFLWLARGVIAIWAGSHVARRLVAAVGLGWCYGGTAAAVRALASVRDGAGA